MLKITILTLGFVPGIFANQCVGQQKTDNSVVIIDKKVTYEVPMTYELMQIAIALTDTTIVANNYNLYSEIIDTNTDYYKSVMKHFGQYRNHRLIQNLNKSLRKNSGSYISNLHLAYNSILLNKTIKRDIKYPFMHRLAYHFKSTNRKLVNDFARVSNFTQFFNQHRDYYSKLLEEVKQNANVNEQQIWLEKEFENKYDEYNIVISPLMNSTHFTKRFKKKQKNKSIMWVSRFGYDVKHSEKINSALYTGIVMTEIDHNYVNPLSDKFKKQLDRLMGNSNRTKWTNGGGK